MAPRIRAIHENYRQELETVGRLLSDYGELEIGIFNCVAVTRAHSFDDVFKSMFATRGEKRRIDAACRLGLPQYEKDGFKQDFEAVIAAMHHCRLIRNQYAHAHWHNPGDGLCFVDLEGLASTSVRVDDFVPANFRYVNQALLDEQEDFYTYTEKLLMHLNYERRRKLGQIGTSAFGKPSSQTHPRLFIGK